MHLRSALRRMKPYVGPALASEAGSDPEADLATLVLLNGPRDPSFNTDNDSPEFGPQDPPPRR